MPSTPKITTLFLFFLVLLPGACGAQGGGQSVLQIKKALGASAASRLRVERDGAVGKAYFGPDGLDFPVQGKLKEERARSFLGSTRQIWGIDSSPQALVHARSISHGDLTKVTFSQHYGGIQVLNAKVEVTFDSEGNILSVHNGYDRYVALESLSPDIPRDMVPAMVKERQALGDDEVVMVRRLGVFRDKGSSRLVWDTIVKGGAIPSRVLLDAKDGRVLLSKPIRVQ